MKKLVLLPIVLISLQSYSQSFTILKRFEMNTFNLKSKEQKMTGQFIITDSVITIKNDVEDLNLKVKLYSITKNDIIGISGNIICKDEKGNQYSFTIMNNQFSCTAELFDEKRNDINYKTIIYTTK